MDSISGYLFTALWAVLAVYLLVMGKKESRLLYGYSLFFFFMAAWYLANERMPENLFEGGYGIIFRVIVGVALVLTVLLYINRKQQNNK